MTLKTPGEIKTIIVNNLENDLRNISTVAARAGYEKACSVSSEGEIQFDYIPDSWIGAKTDYLATHFDGLSFNRVTEFWFQGESHTFLKLEMSSNGDSIIAIFDPAIVPGTNWYIKEEQA